MRTATPLVGGALTLRLCVAMMLVACTEDPSLLPRTQLASDTASADIDTDTTTDADGDGYTEADGDCDDANPFATPDNTEDLCNGFDDDCDTDVDEDCYVTLQWLAQTDDHLYGYADDKADLDDGGQFCRVADGDEFSPTTEAISTLVLDALASASVTQSEALIDLLYYTTAEFGFWGDDVLYEWENWASDEPVASGDAYVCAAMSLTTGEWTAADCGVDDIGILCELECETYYLDADGDGYGDPAHSGVVCGDAPSGGADNADDTDDSDPDAGSIYEGTDADGDGYAWEDDCDDDDAWTNDGIPEDFCDDVDNDCDGDTDEDCYDTHGSWVGWVADDGTLWMRGDTETYATWDEVDAFCETLGGHLPSLNTELEEYLFELYRGVGAGGARYTWLGLSDQASDDTLAWEDGSAVDYTRWATSEPSLVEGEVDCIATDITTMTGWVRRDCASDNSAVYCEVPCDDSVTWYLDLDGDGYGDPDITRAACGPQPSFAVTVAGDCDDTDPDINEGAQEVCDDAGVDEDCDELSDNDDPSTDFPTWYSDEDGDGEYGTATEDITCDEPSGTSGTDDDCDDADLTINTTNNTDTCNGLDDDCNGTVDDDCACTYVEASDGSVGRLYCAGDISWARAQAYCASYDGQLATIDDATENATVFAEATAISDEGWWLGLNSPSEGTWTWADGTAVSYTNWEDDEPDSTDLACGYLRSGDGTWEDTDCEDDNPFVCELSCTDWYADLDGDGYGGAYVRTTCGQGVESAVANDDDCDDTDPDVNPGAVEVCDDADVDEDCNELADDDDAGATELLTWYVDSDGDLEAGTAVYQCEAPSDSSTTQDDCDDTDPDVNTTATEVCDGVDNDCDDDTDEGMTDSDGDGTCDAVDACPDDSPDDLNQDGICDSDFAVTALGFWPGQTSTIVVVNAPAGTDVYLGASAAGEGSGPCLTADDGSDVCAGLTSLVGLGVVEADANGNAFLQVTTPSSFASGTQVWIQALHLDGSGDATPVMTQVVQ